MERGTTRDDGHGDVTLQPGPAAGCNPADGRFRDQGRREAHRERQE